MRNFFRAEGAGRPLGESAALARRAAGGKAPREAERRWRKMPKGGGGFLGPFGNIYFLRG